MATAQFLFFDKSVSVTPPGGHAEPLPITLGPGRQPNDLRLMFISASAAGRGGETSLTMKMSPNPPTGFTAAYFLSPSETHGVYYRRIQTGDVDASVSWPKPSGWQHFMHGLLTVRGHSPTVNPTAGSLTVIQTGGDTSATVSSVTVPGAGTMLFFVGNVPTPGGTGWPAWAVAMGVPTGWTHLEATDKSGQNFYAYGTEPSIVVFAKSFIGAGSTGAVSIPTARGGPAFAGLWMFLTPASDVTGSVGAV